jgi:hypothetical protein
MAHSSATRSKQDRHFRNFRDFAAFAFRYVRRRLAFLDIESRQFICVQFTDQEAELVKISVP